VSTTHLRWQKIINELRYLYGELDFTQEMAKAAGPEFQKYYEEYCRRNNIDLAALNSQNQEKLSGLFGEDPLLEDDIVDETGMVESEEEDSEEFNKLMEEAAEIETENEVHKAFCRVFKKLAFHFHPDMIPKNLTREEKDDRMKTFKKALQALEERRYFILIDLADKYGVETPTNYKQQIKWMRKEATQVGEMISKDKRSYNYLFSECETDAERDKIISGYMMQVFGFSA